MLPPFGETWIAVKVRWLLRGGSWISDHPILKAIGRFCCLFRMRRMFRAFRVGGRVGLWLTILRQRSRAEAAKNDRCNSNEVSHDIRNPEGAGFVPAI